jgi:hypothetical protein
VPEVEDFCWGCTEHSENAAQGSVRVQASTVTITMTYPLESCLDRRVPIVRDGRRLAAAMDTPSGTTPGVVHVYSPFEDWEKWTVNRSTCKSTDMQCYLASRHSL